MQFCADVRFSRADAPRRSSTCIQSKRQGPLRQRRHPVVAAAASPSRAAPATTTSPDAAGPGPGSLRHARSHGPFLSRQDCLSILNGIADSYTTHGRPLQGEPLTAPAAALTADGGGIGYDDLPEDMVPDNGADDGALMSQVLDTIYDELEEVFMSKRGFIIPRKEAALVDATGGSATYGEITGDGVRQFLAHVPLQPDDVLVDLGSGLGRLVLQMAASARLRRCVGLELSACRHEQAGWAAARLGELGEQAAAEEAAASGAPFASGGSEDEAGAGAGAGAGPRRAAAGGLLLSPVELRCEDILTAELGEGSAFFLCSTAFSAAAARAIAERLAAHPRFRLLVTSRALPFPSPLVQLGQFRCAFTWTAAGTAYVYVRSLAEAPKPLLAAFLSAPVPRAGGGAGANGAGCAEPALPGHPQGQPQEQEQEPEDEERAPGGVAWLPSTCTLAMVPGDLMV
ncbi:hypothetical protein HXX76_010700 [Chlamydomonas incerta]|uniref:Histone-lysine N-methyltransferase, H3 lysine-79 specific n=1 Tax=Chlamydomonas incerta TaxID=51695 RepID=A0A835T0U8_CHLIN|nr:hypothetical protein HXX76_010700 [Chlamydomonas incerta]|eukprot:KAG2429920.1 hypothetical protein HXX76_010700 [Chlamydomonas incerta]